MYWIKIVNILISIHLIEGFEERTQSSNRLRYFSKNKEDSLSLYSASFAPFMCFRCRNCSHVENHTFRVSCPAPNCCYTAHAKNHTRGLFYIIRGCGKWDRVNGCRWTCQHAREDHLWTHPLGLFIKCITCNEGDTDECNGQHYESPLTWKNPPPSLLCYQCRKCNNVTAKTPKVICELSRCCYTALLTDQPNEEIFAVRGCVSSNKSCFDSCNQIKREHLQAHANGTFNYCMTCNIGETDECNRNSYDKANVLKSIVIPIAVRCYHCHNCNKVLSTTPTVHCPQPNCCYVALLKDRQVEPSYAVRGCYTQSEDCSQMCASIERNHLQMHYNGLVSFCTACGETEGDKCNRNTYNSFNTTRKHPIVINDDTYCFSCKHCKEVLIDKPKIVCASGCCFLKIVQGISERGCVSNFSGRCGEYCMKKPDEFCYTCSENNCNNETINSDTNKVHAVFKRTSHIKCYECDDCYTVSDEVHKPVDCPDGCCLIVWWTSNKGSTVTRKCVSLNGKRCQDSCERTRENMRRQDPTGVLRYCEDCMIDKCNYIEITSTPMTLAPHINCYECKDCNGANAKINITVCMTDCCYSATIQSDGKSSTVRACAKIQPESSCREYCEEEFKEEHPDGLEKTCTICQTDKCNSGKSTEVIETHISKVNIEIVKCYKCANCAKISLNTTLCNCKSKCCVTLIKTENGVTSTRRDCAPSKGILCQRYCAYIATIIKVEFCEVCNINKCNRMPVGNVGNETEKSQDIHHLGIHCYKCLNCMTITKNTHFELCDDGCCYATNVEHDDGTVVTRRDCAKIIPGLTCKQYCAEIKKDHTVANPVGSVNFTCNSCASEKCNDKDLNHVSLISVPNPISHPIFCYNCIGCYALNNKTDEKIECPDNCCYTAIWTEYGNMMMARLCAFLDGERCSNFCSYLTKRIKNKTHTGVLHHCRTCRSENCNSNQLPQPDATFKPRHDVIKCYDCEYCDKISGETDTVRCLTGCCYLELKRLNDGMRVTNRRCAKIFPGTACNHYCTHSKKVHGASNRHGAVIHCQVCTTEKCNSQELDTDEIGIVNKDPVKCFECKDCYTITNDTSISCETECCFTVIWTQFTKSHIRRGCIKRIDTPCSKYCQNIERTVIYNDPSGKVHNCDYCITNECNRLVGHSPEMITPQPFSCYNCSNCTELALGDRTTPCYNYCCYVYIEKLDEENFSVQRGCAEIFPSFDCDKYCPTLQKDTHITNCEACSQDLCNTKNLKTELEKLAKAHKSPP